MEKSRVKNSFLIATNRDYNKHAKIVVDQLESYGALNNGEIIICCPFSIDDERINYVKDEKCLNGNTAFNVAATHATGEFIYILCDDHYVPKSILKGGEFLNSPTFLNRKFKIASIYSGGVCHIGAIPNFPETNFIARNVMCRFPFFTREMYAEHLNGFVFHPNFDICSHFADNYLSYFLAINGEPAIECDYIKLIPLPETDQFDDGSVEPFGGSEKKYPTGYIESLSVYLELCRNLKKGDSHVSVESQKIAQL
tara:strand:+ start:506 stop:1267 length:762 start_codon:yes stop_codon:yes gene_type:complete